VIEQRFRSNQAYVAKFNAALPGAPINIDTIVQAVAAFERTIEPEQAPFDRWVAGDEAAISTSAKRGFELFTSKALCFACHTGWRFTDDKFHDIGTTTTDRGRGVTLKDDPLMQFAFRHRRCARSHSAPLHEQRLRHHARSRGAALRKGWDRAAEPFPAAAAH